MEIKVENGRLIFYKKNISCDEYECHDFEQIILDVDAKELAKALKPYLDSIPNCECGKK
jgi:hypothetical protein